jgi:PAS domain S-box-containing protein
LIYATPSIERWLGYHPEELVGVELSTIGHPDDALRIRAALDSVQPNGSVTLTHRIRHRDGSWHTLETTIVSLRENPVVEAVLFASTDVTARVALEQERERLDLERRVSHRLEAVGQLSAGIAHEINTPLQFVGDSIVFLQEAVEDLLILAGRYRELMWLDVPLALDQRRAIMTEAEEQADLDYLLERIPAAFERTTEGVQRVRSIVQAMKRFSHPSDGEIAPEDLGEAIETTLAVCRNEYKYVAEVELELGEVPPVPCNLGEINQVLLNLIVNAAQAIEEDRARSEGDAADRPLGLIRISTRVEGEYAVIQIADNGPGIPKELQDRIYEPFFTTKDVGRGTGQGLALARTTIDRHEGSLECDSAPGAGTTFTIRLPLQSQQERQAIASAERDAAQ